MGENLAIKHVGKFYTVVEGHEAVCEYFFKDPDTIVFHHTFVPPELRGRGIAGQLVRQALEFARHHCLKVIPRCSYVQSYIERHPEYQHLVVSSEEK